MLEQNARKRYEKFKEMREKQDGSNLNKDNKKSTNQG